jgi:hypothetical protein
MDNSENFRLASTLLAPLFARRARREDMLGLIFRAIGSCKTRQQLYQAAWWAFGLQDKGKIDGREASLAYVKCICQLLHITKPAEFQLP